MKCENLFCLYEENGNCILDEISLDIIGQCTDCIYVDIPQKDLNKFKSIHLKKMKDYL